MKKLLIILLFLLSLISSTEASPVLPARIGGSVIVDGTELTSLNAAGYVFRVTGRGGKGFSPPAEDRDGLNGAGKYIIDIPLFDPANQPEGVKPGSIVVIHAYKNGTEMKIIKPARGEIAVGKSGTITPVDIVISGPVLMKMEKNKR